MELLALLFPCALLQGQRGRPWAGGQGKEPFQPEACSLIPAPPHTAPEGLALIPHIDTASHGLSKAREGPHQAWFLHWSPVKAHSVDLPSQPVLYLALNPSPDPFPCSLLAATLGSLSSTGVVAQYSSEAQSHSCVTAIHSHHGHLLFRWALREPCLAQQWL